jgi:hypothetical protein
VLGLYRGLEALLWRNGIWNSCYFGVAATIRHYYPLEQSSSDHATSFAATSSSLTSSSLSTPSQRLVYDFMVGATSGGVATTFNTPVCMLSNRSFVPRTGVCLIWHPYSLMV